MKVLSATLATETNTFLHIPTSSRLPRWARCTTLLPSAWRSTSVSAPGFGCASAERSANRFRICKG